MRRSEKQIKIKKFNSKMQASLLFVICVVTIAFLVLIGRLLYLKNTDGDRYEKRVLSQQTYVSNIIPYKRGDIKDSKGTVLATSIKVYNLILDPKIMLEKETYKEPTIKALTTSFDITSDEIEDVLTNRPDASYVVMKKGLSLEEVTVFKELEKEDKLIKGVWFEEDYVRTYPLGDIASQVIGFTSKGNVGTWGIEEYYNNVLNGSNGREYGYFDAQLNLQRNVKTAKNGNTIITTLDANIQTIVQKHIDKFNEEIGSKETAVLIMDPNNGGIIAMASKSHYDLNNPRSLEGFYSKEEIKEMTEEEQLTALNAIWRNYCLSNTYEPGSTFKPFTIAAALEEGVISPNDTFVCDGGEVVAGKYIRCNKRAPGHGTLTLEEVVMNSCNDALMQIGAKLGRSYFDKYQKNFNFGTKLGVDLPGEEIGILFKKEALNPQELATASFGQGENVTMLQMASAFSSLINGGNYYIPHVMKQVVNEYGATVETKDSVLARKTITSNTSDYLRQYLYQTVENGTAKKAKVEGYQIGGKTGTAEKIPRGNKKFLVSFLGFAPVNNPQIVIYVIVDEPNVEKQSESVYATNLAGDILEEIFPFLDIYPTEEVKDSNKDSDKKKDETTPVESNEDEKKGNKQEDNKVQNEENQNSTNDAESQTEGDTDNSPDDEENSDSLFTDDEIPTAWDE